MKSFYLTILLLLTINCVAQVGINTTSPNAQLEIKSSNQATPDNTDGIIIPKIDAFPVINPTVAQQGMMVYLTTTVSGKLPGFYY
jgi:trimeric autotransporter adhesin